MKWRAAKEAWDAAEKAWQESETMRQTANENRRTALKEWRAAQVKKQESQRKLNESEGKTHLTVIQQLKNSSKDEEASKDLFMEMEAPLKKRKLDDLSPRIGDEPTD